MIVFYIQTYLPPLIWGIPGLSTELFTNLYTTFYFLRVISPQNTSKPPPARTTYTRQCVSIKWLTFLLLKSLKKQYVIITYTSWAYCFTHLTNFYLVWMFSQSSFKKTRKKKNYENRLFILQKGVCLFYPSVSSLTTGYCCSFFLFTVCSDEF